MKTIYLTLKIGFICFILMSGCNNEIDQNPSTMEKTNMKNIEFLETFSKEFSAYFPKKEEIEKLDFLNADEKQHLRNLDGFFEKTTNIKRNISTSDFTKLINEIDGYVNGLNLKNELSSAAARSPKDVINEHLQSYCPPPNFKICFRFPPLSPQHLECLVREYQKYFACLKRRTRVNL